MTIENEGVGGAICSIVMPGLEPGIHGFFVRIPEVPDVAAGRTRL
jgi:hypothetical protein